MRFLCRSCIVRRTVWIFASASAHSRPRECALIFHPLHTYLQGHRPVRLLPASDSLSQGGDLSYVLAVISYVVLCFVRINSDVFSPWQNASALLTWLIKNVGNSYANIHISDIPTKYLSIFSTLFQFPFK